jgi:hypothetical protein
VTWGDLLLVGDGNGLVQTRADRDVVQSDLLPEGTIVKLKSSNSQMMLSTPWPGPSGIADLTFHHDLHNYCVQFEIPVQ